MARTPSSLAKRQREQAKRERHALKAEKKAQRKKEEGEKGAGPPIEPNEVYVPES